MYLSVIVFILGAAVGSFINCQAGRIAEGVDWTKGRSHCDSCGHALGALDLIPIVSWLMHGGKCRYCGAKIPADCLFTEAGMGVLFAGLLWKFGFSWDTVVYMILVSLLLGASLVDLKIYEIPDGYVLAGVILWLISLLFKKEKLSALINGLAGGVLIGGGMLGLSLLFDKISGKESLGGGDIKLFFMTGLFLGPACGFFGLILSCILGILMAGLRKEKRIPFGPSISIAAVVCLFVGTEVIQWYIGLLG